VTPLEGEDPIAVWRADRPLDFWGQSGAQRYADHLAELVARAEFTQRRLLVYDDTAPQVATPHNIIGPDHIFFSLQRAHSPGTFWRCPQSVLEPLPTLRGLIYGVTYYPRRHAAIIPIPNDDDLRVHDLHPDRLSRFLEQHSEYDASHGPMRAVISLDPAWTQRIGDELARLLEGPEIELVK
jgi:hypothetical protein